MTRVISLLVAVCACAPPPEREGEPPDDNGACTGDDECAPGVCDLRRGVCLVDECASGCDADLVCAHHGREKRCEAAAERGEQCHARDDVGTEVDLEKPCVLGLECVIAGDAFGEDGRCVPSSARIEGEPCRSNNECTFPLGCSSFTQRCARAAGDACADASECASALCGPDGLCAARECDAPFDACEDGAVCGGGDCGLTCAPPGAVGAVCAVDDGTCFAVFPCADGLVCSDLGVCEAS
jgi:hypothetical protein